MYIHGRGEPDSQVILFHFPRARRTYFIYKIRIPGTCQQGRTGPCCCTYAQAGPDPHTRRPVCRHQVGNAVFRKVSHTKGIGNTRIGLSAKQIYQLSVCQLGKEFFHGSIPVHHIHEHDFLLRCIRSPLISCRISFPVSLVRRIAFHKAGKSFSLTFRLHRKLFKAAVRQHSFGKLTGCHALLQHKNHSVRFFFIYKRYLFRISHRIAQIEAVFSRFHYISGFRYLSGIVITRHGICRQPQCNLLCLSRLQAACLCKSAQCPCRLAQPALRGAVVQLYHFLARKLPYISDTCFHNDLCSALSLLQPSAAVPYCKRSIGQSVAKGIIHLFSRPRNRLKIPVAHINIFRIIHIIIRVIKSCRGRIIIKGTGKSIHQLSGRISIRTQDIRYSEPAFNASLPCEQYALDLLILLKPGRINHSAYIQHYRHFGERRRNGIHHFLFLRGKIKVSVARYPFSVPVFPREAADSDNRNIRISSGCLKQPGRHRRLHGFTVFLSLRILLLYILFIETGKFVKNLKLPLFLLELHALINIPGIGGRNFPASAASSDIIDLRFSEKGNSAALLKRQHAAFVFQQHHTFRGRLP